MNTSHMVREVRTKALLVKWFGMVVGRHVRLPVLLCYINCCCNAFEFPGIRRRRERRSRCEYVPFGRRIEQSSNVSQEYACVTWFSW